MYFDLQTTAEAIQAQAEKQNEEIRASRQAYAVEQSWNKCADFVPHHKNDG